MRRFWIYKRIIFDSQSGGLQYRLDRSRIATSLRCSTNQPTDRCPGPGLSTPLERRTRQAVAVPLKDLSGHRSEPQRRARASNSDIASSFLQHGGLASLRRLHGCSVGTATKCGRPSEGRRRRGKVSSSPSSAPVDGAALRPQRTSPADDGPRVALVVGLYPVPERVGADTSPMSA